MNEFEIRRAICNRLDHVAQSCNSFNIAYNEGIIIGLLWALRGEDPGRDLFRRYDGQQLYDLAGIPTRRVGKHFHYAFNVPDVEAELKTPCSYCKEEGVVP